MLNSKHIKFNHVCFSKKITQLRHIFTTKCIHIAIRSDTFLPDTREISVEFRMLWVNVCFHMFMFLVQRKTDGKTNKNQEMNW